MILIQMNLIHCMKEYTDTDMTISVIHNPFTIQTQVSDHQEEFLMYFVALNQQKDSG